MVCKNCGTILLQSNTFCSNCGSKNEVDTSHNIPNNDYPLNNSKTSNKDSLNKKRRIILTTVSFAVILILLSISTVYFIERSKIGKISSYIQEGDNYLSENKFKEARASYEKAISINVKKETTYIKVKDMYLQKERLNDAYSIIKLGMDNKANANHMSELLEEISNKFEVTIINDTVNHNNSYSLPEEVNLILNNNETVKAVVNWKTPSVTTDKIGSFDFKSTALEYGRPVKLTLKVMPVIFAINTMEAEVLQGDSYTLPIDVLAVMSDDSTVIVSVTWNVSEVDTSKVGIQEFEGSIQESTTNAKLKLNVKEKEPI
jgi:tetratricopeptide (TPR) repeat protein